MQRLDVMGQQYGRLTVIGDEPPNRFKHRRVRALCECGREIVCGLNELRTGNTRSCGCIVRERASAMKLRHGMSNSPEFQSWATAKQRCTNTKNPNWIRYGGRGITMCERWLNSFDSFLADMGPRPNGTSLDRINNDGNYEPGNCRWANDFEQSRNRRNVCVLTLNGVGRKIHEWERITGLSAKLIRQRKGYGWSDEKTLTTAVDVSRHHKSA